VRSDRDVPSPQNLPLDLPTGPLTFVHRAGSWDLTVRARVVGILNLTPDSFFDGGRYTTKDAALARAETIAAEGADAIDVGGQSTRPGGTSVGTEEEWRRLKPALAVLARRPGLPVSIDTYHAEVARRALDEGVSIVNDVSGLGVDPALAEEAARSKAGLVLMHSRGAPDGLHASYEYADVGVEVAAFLEERMRLAESRGTPRERIALDPGIGFSKRAEQSLDTLRAIPLLHRLGRPVYVGVSRKSFLGALTGEPVEGRLAAGIGATVAAYALGARIFRTHDVRETVVVLRLAERLLFPDGVSALEPAGRS
jgi:dihydropteroate synthase